MTDFSPTQEIDYLRDAVSLARANIPVGGRPFGAVVVNHGKVIARAANEMHLSHDTTDHAELLAIRKAARTHGPDALKGSVVYASGEPCAMCMAALRLVGVRKVVYAYSSADWAPFNQALAARKAGSGAVMQVAMAIDHAPLEGETGPGLYQEWAQAQGSGA